MTQLWIDRVRDELNQIQVSNDIDAETREFFNLCYRANIPAIVKLADWPALQWSPNSLQRKLGGVPVEIQAGRADDPLFELNSYSHKKTVLFHEFVHLMMSGRENDVYMTAQNRDKNADALAPLWADVGPLPACLVPDATQAFFWLGNNTMTPLHHDETNNLMCQVLGMKQIRLFAPEERSKLSPSTGVHSSLGWVTDEMIAERGLRHRDVWLHPGYALFLPIGWWHCVKAFGVACTLVYTSFIWPNYFGHVGSG